MLVKKAYMFLKPKQMFKKWCKILNKAAKTFLNKVVDTMEDNEIEFANPKQSVDQTQSEMHETIEKLDVAAIAHDDEIENYEG